MAENTKQQGGFSWHEPARPRGVLLPSATCEWSTPWPLFRPLDKEFRFSIDVAASSENTKCIRYYTKEQNGLAQSWRGERVWCNPPYDVDNLTAFAAKAWGDTVTRVAELAVLLAPVKSDQAWWHEYALKSEVRFIRGRVSFGDAANAPMPVCLLVFSPNHPPRMTSMEQPQIPIGWKDR